MRLSTTLLGENRRLVRDELVELETLGGVPIVLEEFIEEHTLNE
jgi:hypothetical protein